MKKLKEASAIDASFFATQALSAGFALGRIWSRKLFSTFQFTSTHKQSGSTFDVSLIVTCVFVEDVFPVNHRRVEEQIGPVRIAAVNEKIGETKSQHIPDTEDTFETVCFFLESPSFKNMPWHDDKLLSSVAFD